MSYLRDFGAVGDGVADDTDAILHAVKDGDGRLTFGRGVYRITRTIEIDTSRTGRVSIDGDGGLATVVMDGPGPAFRLVGTHFAAAHPNQFKPEVWQDQRMPTVSNIEILGKHKEANGFELVGTMQATFEGVAIRECHHGIHLVKNNRNVLISHCHIYHNRGIGIFLDRVNLHQVNIVGCHISYNHRGGIRIDNGSIRNIQITGNDIEYNYPWENVEATKKTPTAEIWIDGSEKSVREGTIASNTIQARHSFGGANIRMIGGASSRELGVGLWTIVGNLCGSNETNMHFVDARAVTVTGNSIYAGYKRNLLMDGCREMAVVGNTIDHNPDSTIDAGMVLSATMNNCRECIFANNVMHDNTTAKHRGKPPVQVEREAVLEIIDCNGITIVGCRLTDPSPVGILLKNSQFVTIANTSVLEEANEQPMEASIRWRGDGQANMITGCTLGKGASGSLDIDVAAEVKLGENLVEAAKKSSG